MKKNINALILVGGKSLRMGESKAHLQYFQNEPAYISLHNKLKDQFDQVLLSVNASQVSSFSGVNTLIVDEYDAIGPMGALKSYFDSFDNDVFVIACDIPLMKIEWIELLIKNITHEIDSIVLETINGIEPLFAIYRKPCKEKLKSKILDKDYKMKNLLNDMKIKKVLIDEQMGLLNINTPENLNKFKRKHLS